MGIVSHLVRERLVSAIQDNTQLGVEACGSARPGALSLDMSSLDKATQGFYQHSIKTSPVGAGQGSTRCHAASHHLVRLVMARQGFIRIHLIASCPVSASPGTSWRLSARLGSLCQGLAGQGVATRGIYA